MIRFQLQAAASRNGVLPARLVILPLLFFCLLLPCVTVHSQSLTQLQPEEAGFSGERLERLTGTLNRYVDEQRLPGGVALVARGGRILYHEPFGYLDLEAERPMSRDAIFRIASQTKAIVSVAVMMLQEEGLLLISDPVGNYLPEFRNTTVAEPDGEGYRIVDAKRPITIRHLLTHTAGIDYGRGRAADLWEDAGMQGWYFADRDEPIRQTVARLAQLPMQAHPGEAYVYGYATDILGVVVEEVSGMSLDRFLRDRVFIPLGMNDTRFYLDEEKMSRLATVYSALDGSGLERAPDPGAGIGQGHYVNGPRKSYSGGAGLLSTGKDYARFLQMMLNGGELDGVRLLSPSTVDLMTVNHLGNIEFRDGQGFGLGFYTVEDSGRRGVPGPSGEFGWGGAYHSTYWVDPFNDLLVVFFTQLIPAGDSDIHGKLRALVYQALVD